MDGNNSRFAELAMEMMGSQMAQKFLKEIWEEASESVKQKIANKVIERFTASLEGASHWDLDHFIKYRTEEIAKAILESPEWDAKLRATLIEELEKNWEPAVQNRAASALREVLKGVYEKLGHKAHER